MNKLHLTAIFLIILLAPSAVGPSISAQKGPGYRGDGVITVFNTHTNEFETIKYRNGSDIYIGRGIDEINRILRCRLTGHEAKMSIELIELIDRIEDHFGIHRIEVISAYRSPKLNGILRATGRRVARNSLHMEGLAMDIRIRGVPLQDIRNYAASLKKGGVGYYKGQFVHLDVGDVRYW